MRAPIYWGNSRNKGSLVGYGTVSKTGKIEDTHICNDVAKRLFNSPAEYQFTWKVVRGDIFVQLGAPKKLKPLLSILSRLKTEALATAI